QKYAFGKLATVGGRGTTVLTSDSSSSSSDEEELEKEAAFGSWKTTAGRNNYGTTPGQSGAYSTRGRRSYYVAAGGTSTNEAALDGQSRDHTTSSVASHIVSLLSRGNATDFSLQLRSTGELQQNQKHAPGARAVETTAGTTTLQPTHSVESIVTAVSGREDYVNQNAPLAPTSGPLAVPLSAPQHKSSPTSLQARAVNQTKNQSWDSLAVALRNSKNLSESTRGGESGDGKRIG
ncbi:unnamed protein product, partial [Amoebophrya sp. A120]